MPCLDSATAYVIGISVIRQVGVDSPKYVHASTLVTVVPIVLQNTSSLFLYKGEIIMTFVEDVPTYNNAPLTGTFLYPAMLTNTAGNVSVDLSGSTVQSMTATTLHIVFSVAEAQSLISQIFASSHFTPMSITYGSQPSTILLSHHCLIQASIKLSSHCCFVIS